MKIKFIYPDIRYNKLLLIPHITFPVLAALTPSKWEVEIIDANFQEIAYDQDVDIVGFTATVSDIKQVYRMAKKFKEKGAIVVIGGPFATLCPDETLQHADTVFIGEAELTWPQFLKDYEQQANKRIYRPHRAVQPQEIPLPRRELLDPKGYMAVNTVMATRGCVHRCRFCTVRYIYPCTRYTTRPIKNIIEEIETTFIGSYLQKKFFIFLEDNFIGDREYTKKLLSALVPLKKKWYSLATLDMADDEELLKLAKKAGCCGIEVGIESFNPEVLKSQKKVFNRVEKYKEQIEKFHTYGISVQVIAMLGFDQDTKDTFKITLDSLIKIRADIMVPLIFIPYPNTPPFFELEREGRILTMDWDKYDGAHCVYKPKNMASEEVEEGCLWLLKEFYSYKNILRRIPVYGMKSWYGIPVALSTANILIDKFRREKDENSPYKFQY